MYEIDINALMSSVDLSLRTSAAVLRANLIVREPNIAGWRQFLGPANTVGTFGTACGLMAYCSTSPSDLVTINRVAACLKTLLSGETFRVRAQVI
jgi:hypothetical protein